MEIVWAHLFLDVFPTDGLSSLIDSLRVVRYTARVGSYDFNCCLQTLKSYSHEPSDVYLNHVQSTTDIASSGTRNLQKYMHRRQHKTHTLGRAVRAKK